APTTTATSTPLTLRTSGPYTWTQVSSPALAIGGGATSQLGAVAAPASAPGDRWLIAGTVTGIDGEPQATTWSSPDGMTWTARPLDSGGQPSEAAGVTYWANRAVVVGSVGSGPSRRAAVWISPSPGAPFAPVANTSAFSSPDGATMTTVAGGTLGLFAAGHAGTQQAVWYSSDGAHWIREIYADRLLASEPGAQITTLLVAPQGVIAAGSRLDGALQQAAMWTSANASGWRDIPAPQSFTGPGDREILGLTTLSAPGASAQGTELVAVGAFRSGAVWSPASWVSPDGTSWSQPSLAFPHTANLLGDTGDSVAAAVATTGNELVAVGGGASQQVWRSTNGRNWEKVALPAAAASAAGWRASLVATAGGTTVVADGTFGQPRVLTETAKGWTEPSANPSVFGAAPAVATPAALVQLGGRLLLAVDVVTPGPALGQETSTVDFLSSADGRTWQTLPGSPVFSGAEVTALAAGLQPGSVEAVGGQSPPSSTLRTGSPGAAAWVSADGNTWTAAPGGLAASPGVTGPALPEAATRAGTGYVAVGKSPTAPGHTAAMVWTSATGLSWQQARPLDSPGTSRTADVALGVCARGQQVAAVGSGDQQQVGERAQAWLSRDDGARWSAAAVTPPAAPGADEQMQGCVAVPGGAAGANKSSWVAYGQSTDDNGVTTPALWLSSNGTQWSRLVLPGAGGPSAVHGVAVRGASWLAIGGGQQSDVWVSSDSGHTWKPLDTSAAPWPNPEVGAASITQVAFAGADPLLVGQEDGQLAVWIGTPVR
ncbi:MAG: hypothetical protein J2P57_11675, partial [Acidimicrobiaceae bacterium]|nr:hypothetical protein [Acidimicrobiaceae bacterium]